MTQEKSTFRNKVAVQKKGKTYSEEEINTMILQKVEGAMKARNVDPKHTDKDDAETMNMEEFNYDPA